MQGFSRLAGRSRVVAATGAMVVVLAGTVAAAGSLGASARSVAADPGPTGQAARGGRDVAPPSHVPYQPTGVQDPRPNIVLISTDDQALSDLRWMPKTRSWLADGGTSFSSMLSPHPLCCPARAEMMTGQFAQNNGVHTNAGPFGGLQALKQPDNTLPWWLQQAHYQTAMVGKYLNGYAAKDGVPRGWDYWNAATTNSFGYYDYFLYGNGRVKFYGDDADKNSSVVIAADTARLITESAPDERPFFIWSSYYAPHGVCRDTGTCASPPQAEPRYAEAFSEAINPALRKPSYNEQDVSDKPPVIRDLPAVRDRLADHIFRQRIRALASVDDGVDLTMRTLQATGELDNTLVLFTSDNGYLVGEHRYLGKTLAYEEALRVPLLLRGPGVPAGAVDRSTVTTVDLAPTILHAAGVRPGRDQDGSSLLPVPSGAGRDRDETVLVQAGGNPDARRVTPWMFRGVRTDRYTYLRWTSGFTELYDRRLDPFQLRNVASSDRYARVRRVLEHRREVLGRCAGASCRRTFGPVPGPAR